AGPSGMAPSVLLSLITHPSSPLHSVVAPVVYDLMAGNVPKPLRRVFYGARLVPLVKKDKALRPIACSEALRRVAAKILAKRLAKKFRTVLTPSGQIGVAVPSGLEALAGWTRRSARVVAEGEVFAKVDECNAFNSVHRNAIADAVLEKVPELARYVEAAYGDPSLLFCGGETLSSEMGVQQGDPLGPALFSLAALSCTALPESIRSKLRGSGWYLDDGLIAGPADAVYAALNFIRDEGRKIGLELNVNKTEILGLSKEAWAPYLAEYPGWKPLEELELLGLPCSPDPAGLQAYLEKFAARIRSRNAAIKAVAELDPHVGFLLLRMCTGFAASVHLARAMGTLPEFADIDAAILEGMDPIVPLEGEFAETARLPFRLGGLGLRSVERHAPTAFLAAHLETRALMKLFSSEAAPPAFALPADPLVAFNLARVPLPSVKESIVEKLASSTSQHYNKLQRELSMAIDDAAEAAMPKDTERVIRKMSCGARGASMYLVGPVSYDEHLEDYFMAPSTFTAALHLRLGKAVSHEPGACKLCTTGHHNDVSGHAALKCMKCGHRTRVHNRLRDTLASIATECLLSPTVEPRPFADSNERLDVAYAMSGKLQLIDVAITHPIEATFSQQAASAPGGAATAYQARKSAKYAGKLTDGQVLVPFIVDTFGALGEEAERALRKLVPLYMRRLGISIPVASRIVVGRITTCVIRGMAEIAALA
ncbi:MAG TPA: reverse transcriptase domain-containing protein, partial [Opitutaceae bacterium]